MIDPMDDLDSEWSDDEAKMKKLLEKGMNDTVKYIDLYVGWLAEVHCNSTATDSIEC